MLYDIKNLQKSRSRGAGYKLLVRALRVREGERIAITGPSGCGKSTVLDMLGLALRPDEAETFDFFPGADGTPVRIMDVWRAADQDRLASLRLSDMGYVLQSGELLPFLNVAENMELTARLAGRDREAARRDALALADRLGVAGLLEASPGTLSFGERQRAAIVRALASRPRVILADEPTASLDPFHAEKVMDAFMEAVQAYSAALVLATHNIAWAKRARVREIRFELREDSSGMTAILDGKS